jgi:hypothetical protein
MSPDKRKNRTVYFSKIDPEEVLLLDHAEKINTLTGRKRNFSKYIKKLIADDLKREQYGNTLGDYAIGRNPNYIEDDVSVDVKNDMMSYL